MTNESPLPLSGCTYTWLHQASFEHALTAIAEHGFTTFELTTASPHLFTRHCGPYERAQLKRLLTSLDLRPVSVNPSYGDINVISTNPEIQRISEQQIRSEIELAHELGAEFVVLIPGRRHQLSPAPADAAIAVLHGVLERLVARGEQLGVTLTLENSPYGFLGTSTEQLVIVERFDSPYLGMTYDVANALAIEDPSDGLRNIAGRLRLVHISDTWKDRWAHTSVGRGEVDFAAFGATLREIGYSGATVYELVDGEPVEPRLRADLAALAKVGWSV
jgi:sugar phosphate isomerase/epimerase